MNASISSILLAVILAAEILSGAGCARRMTVATGTVIGLNANPGDGQSQLPQITFAYKRAEFALVPTGGNTATNDSSSNPKATDAYSALAIVDFKTKFFSETSIDQFIATGHASRDIQQEGSEFTEALAQGGSVQDLTIENLVYQDLRTKAATDPEAAIRFRALDALGELVPDDYTYVEEEPGPPIQIKLKLGVRLGVPNHRSYADYRDNLTGSINILSRSAPVSVIQPDGTTRTLGGDDLKRDLSKYQKAMTILRKQVAKQGATQRAFAYYFKSR